MSAVNAKIVHAIDKIERETTGFINTVKIAAHRKPWVFSSCAMGVGILIGSAF